MPAPATGNPVFDALIDQFLKSDPTAAFNFWASPFLTGNQGQRPFGNWLRGRSPELFGQFLGQIPQNPTANYLSFLEGQNPLAQFMALAPSQRGVSYSRFSPTVKPQKPVGFI